MKVNSFINLTKEERNNWITANLLIKEIKESIYYDGRNVDNYVSSNEDLEKEYIENLKNLPGADKIKEDYENKTEEQSILDKIYENPKEMFVYIMLKQTPKERELFKNKYLELKKDNEKIYEDLLSSLYEFIYSGKDVEDIISCLYESLDHTLFVQEEDEAGELLEESDGITTSELIELIDEYLEPFYKPIIYRENKTIRREETSRSKDGTKDIIRIYDGNNTLLEEHENDIDLEEKKKLMIKLLKSHPELLGRTETDLLGALYRFGLDMDDWNYYSKIEPIENEEDSDKGSR